MSCEVGDLIHGYIDGELDLFRSLQVEEHLKSCPSCQAAQREQQDLRAAITRAALYASAPTGLERRVRDALLQTGREETAHAAARWKGRMIWALTGAAVIFLSLVLPLLLRRPVEGLLVREIITSHVRSLQPGHLIDIQSTDQHTVKPWFNGRLDFSPPVVELSGAGFTLVGGRLDYLGDRAIAAVVYRRRQHTINLFIRPSLTTDRPMERTYSQQGYHVVCRMNRGMTMWAVSDVSEPELLQFMDLIEAGQDKPGSVDLPARK